MLIDRARILFSIAASHRLAALFVGTPCYLSELAAITPWYVLGGLDEVFQCRHIDRDIEYEGE